MILDNFKLTGKVALVTGANTGLGQAIAIALAEAGAAVCLVGRSEPNETVVALNNLGAKSHFIYCDLSITEHMEPIINEAYAELGGLDIVVNNAGVIQRNDAIEFTLEQWDSVINLNLRSVFFLSQAAARLFSANRQSGKIINIASMLSFQGGLRAPSYTASKSAVVGLTKALANEWAVKNINVNAIAPGYFTTNNTAALQADSQRSTEILSRIPAGRWGTPSDLGGAAVFLASSASDYLHGITLPVDGGWLAR
jgi:2-deoxy-D-gluconate 3-dehydrogenase